MKDFFHNLVTALQEAGSDCPRLEAGMILKHVLKSDINPYSETKAPDENRKAEIGRIVAKRKARVPLCKILGEKGFYKYDFIVSEDVLSPRPDTEILVEAAIAEAKKKNAGTILDLGTGSGCIILSVLGDVKALRGWAVDVSEKALQVASANAEKLKLDSRVNFIRASWFDDDLPERLGTKFDLIVSNPPYIATSEIADLEPEVREHDPLSALDGGEDGLLHYRQIAKLSAKIINPEGLIFLEGGLNQEKEIAQVFIEAGFALECIVADYAGINRCIILKK